MLPTISSCHHGFKKLHILTDRKEMASVVEMYGALNPGLVVTFRYVDSIDTEAIKAENPDVVIGADLSAPEITEMLHGRENTESDEYRGSPNLTPLSFELPIIVGTKKTMAALPDPVTIKAEELQHAAASLTAADKNGRLVRLGFSPAWNPSTFIDLLLTEDIDALDFESGNVDEELIGKTMEKIKRWRESIPGGKEADSAFDEKYRYIPDLSLILEERIFFARSSFGEWAILPEEMAKKLDIRYFKGERHIPVISVVSAGIPRTSKSIKEAEELIAWLTEADSQIALINRWERDNLAVFGYFGGLSSNREVNEKVIPSFFPAFQGKIPESHYLAVPDSVPCHWKRIRDEVVFPWYKAALTDSPRTPSLSEAYYKWDLSSLKGTD